MRAAVRVERAVAVDLGVERRRSDELHHQVQEVVLVDHVVHLDGVGVVDRGGCPALAHRPGVDLVALAIGGAPEVDDLHGHRALQERVLGLPHLAHAPAAEALDQAVAGGYELLGVIGHRTGVPRGMLP
jgi:hypothetical protein